MDKKCLCGGLSLLHDMLDVYDLWLNRIPEHEKLMTALAEKFHSQLVQNSKDKVYDGVREEIDNHLDSFRTAINATRYGDASPFYALEVVRDSIHQHPVLKSLLVCEDTKGRSDTVKTIETVMTLLAEEDPSTAREPLEKHFKSITCSEEGG
jgi:DNA-binding GntR family transcriptional regulator